MDSAVNGDRMHEPARTLYVDRLKGMLTVLVVFHHAAITYGAMGDWFYRERSPDGSVASLLLTWFCAVNQSFFMGMFFLIAGYFTPDALQRKGIGRFLRDRMLRLGVPLLLFGLVLGPLTVQLSRGATVGDLQFLLSTGAATDFVMGPLWFCWALLIVSWLYVGLNSLGINVDLTALPRTSSMLAIAVWVGLGAFVVRLAFPVGENVLGLQLGYFVGYLFWFAIGCMAARHKLLEQTTRAQAWALARVSLAATPLLPVLWIVLRQAGGSETGFAGGWNVAALAYALWEPLVAWGLMASLWVWGRRRWTRHSPLWRFISDNAYGAFVFHAPVLVLVSMACSPMALPVLIQFLLVASIATLLSFLMASALRGFAVVRNIL